MTGKTAISLLPGHDVVLHACAGDGDRFAQLFRNTWSVIPPDTQQTILRYWTAAPHPVHILLMKHVNGFAPDAVATTAMGGFEIKFCAGYVEDMPDDVAMGVIAHELAHVAQIIDGYADGDPSRQDSVEKEADAMIEEWGFDPCEFDDWVWSRRS